MVLGTSSNLALSTEMTSPSAHRLGEYCLGCSDFQGGIPHEMPLKLDDVGEYNPAIRAEQSRERRAALRAALALKQHHLHLPPRLCRTQELHTRDVEFSAQGGLSLAQKALEK